MKRGRVHHQNVAAHLLGNRRQGAIPHLFADLAHLGVLPLRLGVDRADAAAGDDIVELVEADQLPRPVQLSMGVVIVRIEQGGQDGQEFGIVQEKLALAIGTLVAALGGVGAAVVLQVELAVPGRQAVSDLGFQLAKELPHFAALDLRRGGETPHLADVLQHLPRGTAAAVAVAERHQQRRRQAGPAPVFLLEVVPGPDGLLRRSIGVVGAGVSAAALRGGAEMGEDARPVQALPPEGVVRQTVVLIPPQFGGEKVLQPRLFDQLGKIPGIAEHVGKP